MRLTVFVIAVIILTGCQIETGQDTVYDQSGRVAITRHWQRITIYTDQHPIVGHSPFNQNTNMLFFPKEL